MATFGLVLLVAGTAFVAHVDCRAKPCVLRFRTFEGGENNRSV